MPWRMPGTANRKSGSPAASRTSSPRPVRATRPVIPRVPRDGTDDLLVPHRCLEQEPLGRSQVDADHLVAEGLADAGHHGLEDLVQPQGGVNGLRHLLDGGQLRDPPLRLLVEAGLRSPGRPRRGGRAGLLSRHGGGYRLKLSLGCQGARVGYNPGEMSPAPILSRAFLTAAFGNLLFFTSLAGFSSSRSTSRSWERPRASSASSWAATAGPPSSPSRWSGPGWTGPAAAPSC